MKFEEFDKMCIIVLIGIIILQLILLVYNISFVVGIVNIELSDLLFILFWIVLAFNIGAIVDNVYLE